MRIVVIGGTGLIGSQLIVTLVQRGHTAVAAAPSTGVNTLTGEGLAAVLGGADAVVDVTNSPSFDPQAVLDFFTTSTTNLLAAEAQAGVGHHVALSIVGADRTATIGYMHGKVAQEELITAGSVPYTIVRATQFFEFMRAVADGATEGDIVRATHATLQPIAVADVVAALADATVADPRNGIVEVAGPEAIPLDEILRRRLAHDGDQRTVLADDAAGYFGGWISDNSLIPAPGSGAHIATTTFDDWMSTQNG